MTTVISSRVNRSYLFAPGHNAKLLHRVFTVGADAVILDLEDGVPEDAKDRAREMVAAAIKEHAALVRVNPPRTDTCAADLDAVAPHAPNAAPRSPPTPRLLRDGKTCLPQLQGSSKRDR